MQQGQYLQTSIELFVPKEVLFTQVRLRHIFNLQQTGAHVLGF